MRYLFAVIDTQTNSGTHEETVAIDEFNDKIGASGQRLMAAGLVAPRDAKVFDNRDRHSRARTRRRSLKGMQPPHRSSPISLN
jgi:hypothetical protein